MTLSPRLDVRQSQSLTLTPQLMQSIRLLQLSHLELDAYVDAELLRNPLLERDHNDGEAAPVETPIEVSPYATEEIGGDRSADAIAQSFDTEIDNVFPEQAREDRLAEWAPAAREGGGGGGDLDQYVATRPSLAEHITAQAGLLLAGPREMMVARLLIDGLNEAGYLAIDVATVASQLGTAPAMVEVVLEKLQTLDPPGIFARSVKECLAIQLRERDRLDPLMARLLDHLDLVAARDFHGLCRVVGVERADLIDMLAELRALDPKPGRAFDTGPVEAVVPDVFVRDGPAGHLVELNGDILPRVLVNRVYYAEVVRKTRSPPEKTFLVDCFQSANWLTRSLDQRAQTILKVATEIVRQQQGFLARGVVHLRPMTLKLVAEAIGMHESTVSRVTANKYMATPRGVFEMKYFFTTALASAAGGAEHSAEAVRHRIRQLIDAEAPNAVLSDDTIAEILEKEQAIVVARRTVAKYREAMGIASSVARRREKRG